MKICPVCSREFDEATLACPKDGVGLVSLDTGAEERGENLIGQIVAGRYRLERVVGRGGMGTVYACRHVLVGKAFAMKVLRPGIERSTEVLQRFIREAQSANAVQSRHICEMLDFGQLESGAFYVVMDLLDGASLTRALREGRLDAVQLRDVFVQIAETLDRAHAAGIVHRDLKPDNVILVQDEGSPNFVKLVDFGIAKVMQSEATNLTETGIILGTPYYMSPEQARGESVDARSDIYALGVMMYRAFTGKLPFVADTTMGVLTRHLTETPQQPSKIAAIDPIVERVILRCMEKAPIERFQSMREVAEALRSAGMGHGAGADRATVDDNGSGPLRARLNAQLERDGLGHLLTPTPTGSPSVRAPQHTPSASVGSWPTEPSGAHSASSQHSWDEQSSRPMLLSGGFGAGPHTPAPPPLPAAVAPSAQAALGAATPLPYGAPYGTRATTAGEPVAMPTGAQPVAAAAAPYGPPSVPSGAYPVMAATGPSTPAGAPPLVAPVPPWQGPTPSRSAGPDVTGEAFTARGVVSSRIDVRQNAIKSRRITIWATVAAAVGVVAVSAVTLTLVGRSHPSTSEDLGAATPSAESMGDSTADPAAATDDPADPAAATDDPANDPAATNEPTAAATVESAAGGGPPAAASASAMSHPSGSPSAAPSTTAATTTAPPPPPVRPTTGYGPPPPRPKPTSDIRSPFD